MMKSKCISSLQAGILESSIAVVGNTLVVGTTQGPGCLIFEDDGPRSTMQLVDSDLCISSNVHITGSLTVDGNGPAQGYLTFTNYSPTYRADEWDVIIWDTASLDDISGASYDYSTGDLTLPAGTYIINSHCLMGGTTQTGLLFGFQAGESISPYASGGSNLDNYYWITAFGTPVMPLSHTYVFTAPTLFRCWTSGTTTRAIVAPTPPGRNLTITRLL